MPAEKVSRIPVPQRPAPVAAKVHWSKTSVDAIDHHVWRKQALDAFESHSFTGAPGTERWCSRCTLMLPPDWKDPAKPAPLSCGDPRILPVPAIYAYDEGNPLQGICLSQPNYAGAKVKHG